MQERDLFLQLLPHRADHENICIYIDNNKLSILQLISLRLITVKKKTCTVAFGVLCLQLRTLFCVLLLLSKFANNCVWYSLIPYTSFGFHRSILAFKWTLLVIFDVSLHIRSKVAVFISNLQDFLALQCIFHAKWLYILFQTCMTKSS